ncbi:MAG: noncanonical pyrimidine nucleotidase, YjjG family [Ignavibacteriae bacterium]|nr:noncanonical pyrimidine nucleotidase, YjjG family [Ignavibacteriota bacterium]NOG99836.1 noncanonical pyrimidine nucleotidase, YjjG family [Ignavibacteriota bacterium]
MKYKWLLFDLDGTLFDYDKGERIAFQKTFNDFGLDYKDEYLSIYDLINKDLWKKFERGEIEVSTLKVERFELLLTQIDHKKNAAEFSKKYQTNLSNCTFLLEGVEELLSELEGSFKMMLITNGLKAVQRPRLKNSSIKNYFSDIVISEEVGSAKPDKKIFDTAFEKMNMPKKSEVLMIGDSLSSDIAGGIHYGLDTCWLNSNKQSANGLKPVFEIINISELKKILLP